MDSRCSIGEFWFYRNSLCTQTCALWDHWLLFRTRTDVRWATLPPPQMKNQISILTKFWHFMRVDEIVDRSYKVNDHEVSLWNGKGLFVVIFETKMLFIPETQNPLNAFSFFPPLKNNDEGNRWFCAFCALKILFTIIWRWYFRNLNLLCFSKSFNQSALDSSFNQRTVPEKNWSLMRLRRVLSLNPNNYYRLQKFSTSISM